MDLVKELSHDVTAEYREKQKEKLQRTFVEASETASFKTKDESTPNMLDHISNAVSFTNQSHKSSKHAKENELDAEKKSLPNATKESVLNAIDYDFHEVSKFKRSFKEIQSEKLKTEPYFEEMPSKKIKTEPYFEEMLSERLKTEPYFEEIQSEKLKTESYFGEMPAKKIKTESYFEDVSSESLESLDSLEPCVGDIQSEILESDEDVSLEDQNNPYIDIVLWERPGDCEFEMLNYSVKLSGKALQWNFFKKKRLWECFMNINSHGLCRSTDSNKKAARNVAVTAALKKLRKCCYTVKVKVGVGIDPVVTAMDIMQESLPDDDWNGSDCIEKLMVGWVGDSLGNLGQDTMKAIVETQENQEGFGLKIKKAHEIIVNCEKLLETDNILQNDIVFADFPREDRMLIDKIAGKMDLNTRYYIGKLVVSRKVDVWRLVKQLNKLGGVTEKYELVKPTDKKFISLPASTDI